MAAEERDIEETEEFTLAVKYVLKRQMKDLITQMREQGEEMVVMAVNIQDGTSTHFGTPLGDCFITEQKSLTNNFVTFCKSNGQKKSKAVGTQYSSKKIAATPKGRAKAATSASTDAPTLKITVPKKMSVGISEQELGGLVGRIVASQLTQNKAKGDGSSGGTKFDALLESIKKGKAPDTPSGVTRSGRKVSNKYLEGIKSARKRVKLEKEDSGDEEIPESFILNQLTDLEAGAMKKVQVKTGDGKNIDVQKTTLAQAEQMEILATSIIKQLENIPNVAQRKQVKVVLTNETADCQVRVELTGGDESCHKPASLKMATQGTTTDGLDDNERLEINIPTKGSTAVVATRSSTHPKVKTEEREDSETEYLMADEDDDFGDADTDKAEDDVASSVADDDVPGAVPYTSSPKQAVGMHSSPSPSPASTSTVKPKKKYEKPLYERMPMECEHCGQYVQGKSNLKSHIRRVHLKVKNHKCAICEKGFWSNNALESHMLSVHTRRCDSCQEYVVESVPWSTGVDMRMKRDVICTCGAIVSIYSTFGRKRQYMRDEELEEELRLNDLEEPSTPRHKSTPGTKYACGTCGKLFLKKSNCERHSRAHSDYKGVICNICGNAFTYENSLKHHMETEHGILKHVCKVCGKNYSNDTALKVHLIKTHGETLTGENLVMIVKERTEEGAGSLNEQMDEIMEGEGDGEDLEQLAGSAGMQQIQQGQTEHIVVTSRPDGSTERHIMLTGPEISSVSGEIMDGVSGQMVMSQADLNRITSGQIIVTQGEGGQVHVTSEDPSLDQDSAARIVEQAIQDGHVIAQDGNMSIIIKQMSTDTGEVEMSQ
ncbi:zinc finger and BTB domain-containing protein 24-like isoform X3 [Mya arenaria]|uniref:zinc finger and BTB domain-containing protein 24-like isoform X3 n=1 Tax=Mya arenaria TaxID=6604 RepID=UPI0022E48574|nr:zinc finger and BTB domain-containing protein 24-like isoform X3 [Mya arenaria]